MENYEVAQVFIDASNSVNILLQLALEQMGLDERDLQHIATPLFGVSRHVIHPLSQI